MEKETLETPTPETPQTPCDCGKPLSLPVVVLIAIVALVVGEGVGYYMGTTNDKLRITNEEQATTPTQTEQSQQATQPPTPTNQPEKTPTADWETYTNSKYGYMFKYPSTWDLQAPDQCLPTCPEGPDIMCTLMPEGNIYPEAHLSVTTYETNDPSETKTKEQADLLKKTAREHWTWESSKEMNISVNNSTAWERQGYMKFTDDTTYFRRYLITINGSRVYEISFWDSANREYNETLNKILSTFEFLE